MSLYMVISKPARVNKQEVTSHLPNLYCRVPKDHVQKINAAELGWIEIIHKKVLVHQMNIT